MGIQTPMTMVTIIFVMIGATFFIISYFGLISEYNSEIVRESLQKESALSATHSIEHCLETDGRITEFDLANKMDECRTKNKADYLEVIDAETGMRWKSPNVELKETGTRHKISINIDAEDETHFGRLYVQI